MFINSLTQMVNVGLFLSIIGIIFGALLFLQVYLSKRKNKWIGFILPMMNIVVSLVFIVGFITSAYSNAGTTTITDANGEIISQITVGSAEFNIPNIILSVLLYNIPTVILLIIYYICRKNLSKKQEINKISIQDL